MSMHVGIDVGGTFTDAVAITDTRSDRGKSLSTGDVTGGIFGSLGVLQDRLGLSKDEFFAGIDRFVLGNTIVTNAIDQMKFSKVGLLTTRGFKEAEAVKVGQLTPWVRVGIIGSAVGRPGGQIQQRD